MYFYFIRMRYELKILRVGLPGCGVTNRVVLILLATSTKGIQGGGLTEAELGEVCKGVGGGAAHEQYLRLPLKGEKHARHYRQLKSHTIRLNNVKLNVDFNKHLRSFCFVLPSVFRNTSFWECATLPVGALAQRAPLQPLAVSVGAGPATLQELGLQVIDLAEREGLEQSYNRVTMEMETIWTWSFGRSVLCSSYDRGTVTAEWTETEILIFTRACVGNSVMLTLRLVCCWERE